jgi:hypothetical protein
MNTGWEVRSANISECQFHVSGDFGKINCLDLSANIISSESHVDALVLGRSL